MISKRSQPQGQLRIIAGRWRGRRLPVPLLTELRPTPDRVRETLFNWLQNELVGSRCLDLFAGTGVLGLEALSRGAASVVMLERNVEAYRHILESVERLEAQNAAVFCADALNWLAHYHGKPFDIVFVDPPYHSGLADKVLPLLAHEGLLMGNARVYLETAQHDVEHQLPSPWRVFREGRAGQVCYWLLTRR